LVSDEKVNKTAIKNCHRGLRLLLRSESNRKNDG